MFDKLVSERKSVGLSSSFVCLLVTVFVSLVLRHMLSWLAGCLIPLCVFCLFDWLVIVVVFCFCLFVCFCFVLFVFPFASLPS